MARRRRRASKRAKRKVRRNILFFFLCLTLVLLAAVTMRMIHTHEQNVLEEESEMLAEQTSFPVNPYSPSNLIFSGEYASYEDDSFTSLQGIDVSEHNGTIDWEKVRDAGIDFAMIRVGWRGYDQGTVNSDSMFETNYDGASRNGLKTGVYFFSQAMSVDEAAEEADMVIDALKGKSIDLPVVFDMEIPSEGSRIAQMSRYEKTQMAVTFLNRVEDAGYQGMLYASAGQMEDLFDLSYLNDEEFWIAAYETYWPSYAWDFDMWQYSSTGMIDGIDGNVDLDLLFVRK